MLVAASILGLACVVLDLFNPYVGLFCLFRLVLSIFMLVCWVNLALRRKALEEGPGSAWRGVSKAGLVDDATEVRIIAQTMRGLAVGVRVASVLFVVLCALADFVLFALATDPDLGGPKSLSPLVVDPTSAPIGVLYVASIALSIVVVVLAWIAARHYSADARRYL